MLSLILWPEPVGQGASKKILVLLLLVAVGLACGCGGSAISSPSPGPTPSLGLSSIITGLHAPLDMQQPNDNTGRFFIVEQGGTIRILQNGALLAPAFLDISGKVVMQGESGLLGLAFHPNYTQNRQFFVNYVRDNAGQLQTVIAEFKASMGNTNVADLATERELLVVNQPPAVFNHKGGRVLFGPDGFLYIGLGDGGGSNDQFGNGQNLQSRLGKLLRIDVNSTSPGRQYAIPPDNPFAISGGLPEIWAYGLRNPWRFSFDVPTGRLFIADVGQNQFEEVDLGEKRGKLRMEHHPVKSCAKALMLRPVSSSVSWVHVPGGFSVKLKTFPFKSAKMYSSASCGMALPW
jgi:glucose/arabinose dehydrogenase